MNQHSQQSIALITGCSTGIGRVTATLLAERGWHVFATARCFDAAKNLASERITPLQLDVTDEASMVAAVEQVRAQAGRIDALINNAGYAQAGPMEEMSMDQVRRQFETNAFGALRMAQLVLPTMRAQGSGRIVNVSTMGGRVVIPFIGLYNSSKFALEAMSDALRMETRLFGVRVIVIEPGGTRTNFNAAATANAQHIITNTNSPYYRFLQPFLRFIAQLEAMSSPPETVAKVILHALTTKRPHARYVATPDARIMLAILPRLSDGMRDALWGWMLGLQKPARRGLSMINTGHS
ncbi:MAG: SDR family oxidoreductase [Chloroflexi bacterium]|nr:SDR family oxidoreductase [Chloroflexota bacterium]